MAVFIMIGPEIGTDPEAALQFCYGIAAILADCDKWLCDGCEAEDYTAQCLLCPLPHGALKPVMGSQERGGRGKWCHVSCAWFMPGINFADPLKLSRVTGMVS